MKCLSMCVTTMLNWITPDQVFHFNISNFAITLTASQGHLNWYKSVYKAQSRLSSFKVSKISVNVITDSKENSMLWFWSLLAARKTGNMSIISPNSFTTKFLTKHQLNILCLLSAYIYTHVDFVTQVFHIWCKINKIWVTVLYMYTFTCLCVQCDQNWPVKRTHTERYRCHWKQHWKQPL